MKNLLQWWNSFQAYSNALPAGIGARPKRLWDKAALFSRGVIRKASFDKVATVTCSNKPHIHLTNNAIRMMMGIGMPRKSSNKERMVDLHK